MEQQQVDGEAAVSSPARFRTDIQALRGLAILLVVLHHTRLGFLNAGYLGVDIFFVISGYLITTIIAKDIQAGTFRFGRFYFRRAKRLLPAAYTTFLIVIILSVLFLTDTEQRDFTRQLIGAVTFTGNISLWLQTGYFEGAAELKPLLHVWSLGIEEQYYLLIPAALVIVPRKFWLPGTILLMAASLAACVLLAPLRPGATFYLLPTRAWELLLGSLGALLRLGSWGHLVLSRLFWPAILALFMVPIVSTGAPHPGLDALIVCCATLVVILRRHPWLAISSIALGLAAIGEFSYSLYLVHWPVFAFANNAYISGVPTSARVGIVGISLVLGYALYRLVELPVRRAEIRSSRKTIAFAVCTSMLLVGASLFVAEDFSPKTDYAYIRRPNVGFGMECQYEGPYIEKSVCESSNHPEIMIWGDSFAMHLVPGVVATSRVGVAQATKSVCGPFANLAAFDEGEYQRPWAEECLKFNQSVLSYLAKAPSVKVVALSSPFAQYVDGKAWGRSFRTLRIANGTPIAADDSIKLALDSMRQTVLQLRALGKRVIVIAPPPSSNFNIGECLERTSTSKIVFGVQDDCQVSVAKYHLQRSKVLEFLRRLPVEAGVGVISFDNFLCSRVTCVTKQEGVLIYRDWDHFSYDGSRYVARRMKLADHLMSEAR